jgi:hypothetical protein
MNEREKEVSNRVTKTERKPEKKDSQPRTIKQLPNGPVTIVLSNPDQ